MGVIIRNKTKRDTVGGHCCPTKEFRRGEAFNIGHVCSTVSTCYKGQAVVVSRARQCVMTLHLTACFGVVSERALQNTPTFPLETISADPV